MNTERDIIIAGNGLAALTLALSLPESCRIAVLCKNRLQHSASSHAQGGIAAVLYDPDTLEKHVADTLTAGAGLCDETAVREILAQGGQAIEWLLQFDVPFDRNSDGLLHLTREGGHSMRRIAHIADHTGQTVMENLHQVLRNRANIQVFERHMALDVLKNPEGAACGLRVLSQENGQIAEWRARYTVLAGGGLGQIYPHTTTPPECTGDSIAMALRAGCTIENAEFIQFHPTGLALPHKTDGWAFLISEAVRGEGGVLRNQKGERFMLGRHPLAELAPRDIVAREIAKQSEPFVWLDISHRPAEFIRSHFPSIYAHCLKNGIDITREAMPVCPVQHYTCGGVATDTCGRTQIAKLFCLGEAACTGLHGANRLASNSLLECVVTACKAAEVMAQGGQVALPKPPAESVDASHQLGRNFPPFSRDKLHQLTSSCLGILRNHRGLAEAQSTLNAWLNTLPEPQTAREYEDRNLLLCAQAVADAAAQQKTNVGAHFNTDCVSAEPPLEAT